MPFSISAPEVFAVVMSLIGAIDWTRRANDGPSGSRGQNGSKGQGRGPRAPKLQHGTVIRVDVGAETVGITARVIPDSIPRTFTCCCTRKQYAEMQAREGKDLVGKEVLYRDGEESTQIQFIPAAPYGRCEMCAQPLPKGETETCSPRCAAYMGVRKRAQRSYSRRI